MMMLGKSLMLLLGLSLPAVNTTVQELPRLVVMDLSAEGGIEAGTVRLLNELLLTEFAQNGKYEVVGGSDIQAMLANEQQKQMLGCSNTECLVAIGGALGANLLAIANIGKIGDYYLFNLKILNVQQSSVVKRFSEQVEGTQNKLMDAVRRGVGNVSADFKGEESQAGVEQAGLGIWPISLLSLGGVSLASGAILGLLARADFEKVSDPNQSGTQLDSQSGQTKQLFANISFATAGVCIVSGVLVWWLDHD